MTFQQNQTHKKNLMRWEGYVFVDTMTFARRVTDPSSSIVKKLKV